MEGRDPRDVESIWDQMLQCTDANYGRKGLAVHRVKLRRSLKPRRPTRRHHRERIIIVPAHSVVPVGAVNRRCSACRPWTSRSGLVGKLRNEPVYALLGGRTNPTLPVLLHDGAAGPGQAARVRGREDPVPPRGRPPATRAFCEERGVLPAVAGQGRPGRRWRSIVIWP